MIPVFRRTPLTCAAILFLAVSCTSEPALRIDVPDGAIVLSGAGDKPVPATGFKGTAILVVNGKPQRIVLEAAGDTKLTGKADVTLPAQPKGAIQLTAPDGKTASAKF